MDTDLVWKMRAVADLLEAMHGRAFAEAFLEDYYRAKSTHSEQRSDHASTLPATRLEGVNRSEEAGP